MLKTTLFSRLDLKEVFNRLNMDLFTTGPAARIAQVDRRTFIAWARRMKIEPVATLEGNRAVYLKEDVEKIAKAIKTSKRKSGETK